MSEDNVHVSDPGATETGVPMLTGSVHFDLDRLFVHFRPAHASHHPGHTVTHNGTAAEMLAYDCSCGERVVISVAEIDNAMRWDHEDGVTRTADAIRVLP